jgi:2'-5' RNA ligase
MSGGLIHFNDYDVLLQRYAVAISPPDTIIEQVRQLKEKLRSVIGWYKSVNALAHITFNVFQADDLMLSRWETYIAVFAAQQVPVSLQFSHTDSFPNGAFFLAPDETSALILNRMMKAFHLQAPLPAMQSLIPHISIGRQLTPEYLSVARHLIREADIRFVCDNLVLRRFNKSRMQYDIYKRFPFGGTE